MAPALDVRTPGVAVIPLKGGKWRVVARSGALLGHLESTPEGYRAMRFSVRERGFRALGDFRTPTDAADALRFA
jgi:hypothetical protein